MRVNVDSQALRDPRFRRAAKKLGVSHHEVLARSIHVWMVCYERREAVITREDVDIAAEMDGFTDAMIASELAERVTETDVYVRGVTERIGFLERQSARGKLSGAQRRQLSAELQNRTSVQQTFDLPLNGGSNEGRTGYGSTGDRTNSPDHALDPDQQNLDHEPPGRTHRPSGALSTGHPSDTPALDPKTPHSANGAASAKPVSVIPEPPEQAITLATLLLDHVVENNAGSRIAGQASRHRPQMIMRWAWVIEKLHRIDKQEWGTIQGTIEWSARDTWWCTRVLGADSLREHWDKIQAQRRAKVKSPQGFARGNGATPVKRGPTAQALDEVRELERATDEDRKAEGVP